MNKHAKGALAAGTAAVLLLGGAGTLAYWSDSQGIGGEDITSGHLSLTATSADTGWVYAAGNANADQPVTTIVPGDKIVSTHTFTINAAGDNLTADLTTPTSITPTFTSSDGGTDSATMDVTATYDVDGKTVPSTITSNDNGKTLTATVEVDFPYGDKDAINVNDTQDMTASLNDVKVTLEQAETPAS